MLRHYLLLFSIVLWLTPPNAHAQGNLKIVVYGDSLTSGQQLQDNETYAAKLGYKLKDVGYTNVDVFNMSRADQTTGMAAEKVGEVVAKHPDVVVVQLGNNEVLRGVNTDVIYKNMVNVLGKIQQSGAYIVLIGVKAPENAPATYARQLDDMFTRLVNFYRVAYYPNALEGISGNADMTLADGYYPNSKAVDYMVENTLLMVDAGLRWRWSLLNDQQDLNNTGNVAMPPPMPSNVEPMPTAAR